jgi:tetratricopeptide (TPR) repeat protein
MPAGDIETPLLGGAEPISVGRPLRRHPALVLPVNVAPVTRRALLLLLLAGLAVPLCIWTSPTQGQGVIHTCYDQRRDDSELHLIAPGHSCAPPGKELFWNTRGPRGLPGKPGKEGLPGAEGPPGRGEWFGKGGWCKTSGSPGKRRSCGKGGPGGLRATLEDIVKFVAALLAAALAGLLALLLGAYLGWLLLLQLLTRWSCTKNRRPASWVRRPRLSIEKLDDSALSQRLGPAITGLIRTQLGPQSDRFGLDYASGEHAVATALDGFKDLSGAARAAVVAIRLLTATLPRRRYVLCGELQPRGPAGPGLSLALRDVKGYHGMVALWAEPLEVRERGAAAYQRMAIPAAAWADACMANMLEDASFSIDPRSWAFSRAGLESQRLGNDDAARSLYEQALGHDGSNAQALANLGLLERRRRDFSRAKELLDRALEVLERRDQRIPRRDQDWYRARYQLAALALNKASEPDEQRPDTVAKQDRQSALEVTSEVARIAAETITELGVAGERVYSRSRWLIPRRCAVFRGCGWSSQPRTQAEGLAGGKAEAEDAGWRRPDVPAGGAWSWNQPSKTVTARRLEKADPDEMLARFLSTTIEPSAFLLLAGALLLGRDDPTMPEPAPPVSSREELLRDLLNEGAKRDEDAPYRLAMYVDELSDVAPRVLYNLACFYTRVREFEKAHRRLEQALLQTPVAERGALRRVVRNDVTLDKLRELGGLAWG